MTLTTEQAARRAQMGLSAGVLGTIVLITAIAPLATDMYVPAFPLVGRDLVASATQVQLTLTTFFVGMALGQLVGGPVSDRIGRRMPLLVSLAVLTVASAVCAFSPSIAVMMLARLVQGFSGGWAMVIARSIVVDLTRGARLVRAMNLVAGVSGIAPIVGPLLGGVILQFSHWRVSFWVVAVLAALMLVAVLVGVPETLPAEQRHGGGLSHIVGTTQTVLRHRSFVGYLLVFGSSMGMIFAYVATSAFVLQSMNGLSPMVYSIDFAFNAVGLTVATLAAARLANRVSTRKVVRVGLAASVAAGVLLLVGAIWFDMPLPMALGGFFVLMTAQGLVGPNAGALASGAVPEHPGTGSALLGFLQWCMAGVIAPLAGLGGTETAVPMAAIVTVLAIASALALRVLAPANIAQSEQH
ncbi:multidrug effflux MFS transporter [Mycobacterium sp. DBP42]|uniref:multidrug effflux MFS transporter n=1 Tax=Mycobacterium sp. DBP42 TaxID=2545267 RepID=UPI00110D20B0|nr:multidrug effflux MFS transporter [Mycobacterium sp. DBP42]TMS51139.1 multidrug effflux MFS transporter [Mycobacterium sp. DBP42]